MISETFQIKRDEWLALCDGVLIHATFNSKGAALAGIEVERRRKQKKNK